MPDPDSSLPPPPDTFADRFRPALTQPLEPAPRPVQPVRIADPQGEQKLPPQKFVPFGRQPRLGQLPTPFNALEFDPEVYNSRHLPHESEAINVLGGAARQLSNWGPSTAGPFYNAAAGIARMIGPVMDLMSHGAFGRGWDQATATRLAARRQEFEMQREQMLDNARQGLVLHRQALMDYDVLMNKFQNGGVDREEFISEMTRLASTHGQEYLLHILANQGIAAVKKQLELENARFNDVLAGALSLANAKGSSGKTVDQETQFDKSLGPDENTPLSGVPGGVPGVPGGAPGAEDVPESAEAFDAHLKEAHGIGTFGLEEAHRGAQQGKDDTEIVQAARAKGSKVAGGVLAATREINKRLENIANGPGEPDQKLDAMKKYDPTIAGTLKSLLDYHSDPKDQDVKHFMPLARAMGYREDAYAAVKKMEEPGGKMSLAVNSVNLFATGVNSARRAMKPLNETDKIPVNKLQQLVMKEWTGDSKYFELHGALRQIAIEESKLAAQGYAPRVSLVKSMLEGMGETASPAQLRAQMKTSIRTSLGIVEDARREWKNITGKETDPPALDQQKVDTMLSYAFGNDKTGEIPSDAPWEALNTSKTAARPDLPERDRWHPPKLAQIKRVIDFLNRHQYDTEPEIQRQVLEGRALLSR